MRRGHSNGRIRNHGVAPSLRRSARRGPPDDGQATSLPWLPSTYGDTIAKVFHVMTAICEHADPAALGPEVSRHACRRSDALRSGSRPEKIRTACIRVIHFRMPNEGLLPTGISRESGRYVIVPEENSNQGPKSRGCGRSLRTRSCSSVCLLLAQRVIGIDSSYVLSRSPARGLSVDR